MSDTNQRAPYEYHIYKDTKGEFRWRLKSRNNKIMGDSGESYKNKPDCVKSIKAAQAATIVDKTKEGKK